jgi:prepilin-type N-terminal cleavage/methylation domain-containing protein
VKSKLRSSVAGNQRAGAFTLIELLVVMAIILILAGLILATSGYVQRKGARSRTETEIAALSAALESYKADNGVYPRGTANKFAPRWDPSNGPTKYPIATTGTNELDARVDGDPSQSQTNCTRCFMYQYASRYLYVELSGDVNLSLFLDLPDPPPPDPQKKSYFDFKPSMLWIIPDKDGNNYGLSHILDPFGNSYGYSTAYQADIDAGVNPPTHGYNPTFDLWSTVGETGPKTGETFADYQQRWIKNW